MTDRLTPDELLLIASNILGSEPLVRDHGLISSASARPQTNVFGVEAYTDIWTKAAALMHSLVSNHPLIDGNKRLGWVAMRVYLEINGVPPLRANVDDAERFVFDIAKGTLRDVDEIAVRLRALV
ncbi:MAG TPA: type II toxin-antitoxin system death-on-curing family toxin [Asanoa sp.]|nr:type II toxin-antitoxin system death-on-curing family toxin [Asanoa sp.]